MTITIKPDKLCILRLDIWGTVSVFIVDKGHMLEAADTTKYLGVDLCGDLQWNHHVDRIVKKANSMLVFLKRNLEISSQDTKTAAHYTLVRPNLEYCASVWNPHHSQLVQKLEMVQRRAARYTTRRYRNTSSVTDMLESLNWESLQSRRTKIQLTMLFKIINIKQPGRPGLSYPFLGLGPGAGGP